MPLIRHSRKTVALRDGADHMFVCLSVCLFVCLSPRRRSGDHRCPMFSPVKNYTVKFMPEVRAYAPHLLDFVVDCRFVVDFRLCKRSKQWSLGFDLMTTSPQHPQQSRRHGVWTLLFSPRPGCDVVQRLPLMW